MEEEVNFDEGYLILTFSDSNRACVQSSTFIEASEDNEKSNPSGVYFVEDEAPENDEGHYGEAIFVGQGNSEEFSMPSTSEYVSTNSNPFPVNLLDKSSSSSPKSCTNICKTSELADQNINIIKYSDNYNQNRKMLRCYVCGKYYRHEYGLKHHICLPRKHVWRKGDIPTETINGHPMYYCPTCSKPFRWLGNLTRHFYVHTGQRFFKCEVCDKEFFSAYQVRRHMNSHTGQRFKCEVCGKPFTCKYACAWHTRQHYAYVE